VDVVVWERGVGLTLACGTGACAVAAVACAKGTMPYEAPFDVRLPGGTLQISVARATGRATMRGPARRVFSGGIE
jgi:diaminopimelate epimerase